MLRLIVWSALLSRSIDSRENWVGLGLAQSTVLPFTHNEINTQPQLHNQWMDRLHTIQVIHSIIVFTAL